MFSHTLSRATYAAMLAAGISLCSGAQAESYESLQRYCECSWQRAGIPRQDWTDCTHDTIVELIADAKQQPETETPSERHLKRCVWRVAKRWQREKRACQLDNCDPTVIATQDSPAADADPADNETELALQDQQLEVAMKQLSNQQREIIQRWSAGQTVKQIATDLNLTSGKVSNLKYKALRKIEQVLQA